MGKLITIVGNLGAGKTTLTKLLCDKGSFIPCWEKPEERPFHLDFAEDLRRWALTNQIDFFLFRCKQEFAMRQSQDIAVFDGGFDQDFHVFTRHLYDKGYLNPKEFNICKRFYNFARDLLPPPDLVIRIIVDIPTLLLRRSSRGRITDDQLISVHELTELEILLDEWLSCEKSSPVLQLTFEQDFLDYTNEIEELMNQINSILVSAQA